MAEETAYTPTTYDVEVMRAVGDGCDITNRDLAVAVRRLWHARPDLITRCEPMGCYGVAAIHPYCGAVLTDAGKQFLAELAS